MGSEEMSMYESSMMGSEMSVIQGAPQSTPEEEQKRKRTIILAVLCLAFFIFLVLILLLFNLFKSSSEKAEEDSTDTAIYIISSGGSGGAAFPAQTTKRRGGSTQAQVTMAPITTTYKPPVPAPVAKGIPRFLCEGKVQEALSTPVLTSYCDFFVLDYDVTIGQHPKYSYMKQVDLDPGDHLGQFMTKKSGIISDVILAPPYNTELVSAAQGTAGRLAVARGFSQLLLDNKLQGIMLRTEELSDLLTGLTHDILEAFADEFSGGYYTLFKYSTIPDEAARKLFISKATQLNRVYLVIRTHSNIFPNPYFPNIFSRDKEGNYSIVRDLEEVVDVKNRMHVGCVGYTLRVMDFKCPPNMHKNKAITKCNPYIFEARKLCRLAFYRIQGINWGLGSYQVKSRPRGGKWSELTFYDSDYSIAKKAEIGVNFLRDKGIYSFIVLEDFYADLNTTYPDCSQPQFAITKAVNKKLAHITITTSMQQQFALQLHRLN